MSHHRKRTFAVFMQFSFVHIRILFIVSSWLFGQQWRGKVSFVIIIIGLCKKLIVWRVTTISSWFNCYPKINKNNVIREKVLMKECVWQHQIQRSYLVFVVTFYHSKFAQRKKSWNLYQWFTLLVFVDKCDRVKIAFHHRVWRLSFPNCCFVLF